MMTQKRKMTLIGTLALVALALPMGVMAVDTPKLIVQGADGTTNKFVVTDGNTGISAPGSGYVGIGTAAPSGPLHIVSSGNTIPAAGMILQHTATPFTDGIVKYFVAPNFTFKRNNDPTVNSGYPRLGDTIGSLKYGSVGVTGVLAALDIRAEKNWTATDTPTFLTLEVNPGGSGVKNRTAITVSSAGTLSVNGGVRIYPYAPAVSTNTSLPARPSCGTDTQGTLWFTKVSGADTLQICADGDGGPGWRNVSISSTIAP